MEGELPQVIHLTELIRCNRFRGKFTDIVADLGIRAHRRFYVSYRKQRRKAKIEERFAYVIDGVTIMFSPDIIDGNVVIELKRTSKVLTIWLGMIQVMCYAYLLRQMGIKVDKCMLITIDAKGEAKEVFELEYKPINDKHIGRWLRERVEQLKRGELLPVGLHECLACENKKCRGRHIYHEFPLDDYIHYVMFRATILKYLG